MTKQGRGIGISRYTEGEEEGPFSKKPNLYAAAAAAVAARARDQKDVIESSARACEVGSASNL